MRPRRHFTVCRFAVHAALCAALAALMAAPVVAQEWPQWRGPARDGVIPAASVPPSWPAEFRAAWRVEIGEGYSSPVVSGGRAFVHSRNDPQEIVTAVDLATGKVAWQQSYDAAFKKNQYAAKRAKGPYATPLAAGGRIVTLGVTGILAAWDAATGRRIWQRDFSALIDTSKLFCGTAASPLEAAGLLIVQIGSDIHGGQILALDPRTGADKWIWKGPGPGYASPILVTIAGVSQIVTMTESSVVGLDAKSGSELWTSPFPDEWHENIATPVWTGSHLIVSGPRQGTHALAVSRSGSKWQATEAWKNADVAMYMSTPVLGDGLLYGHSSKKKGQFVAVEAATGALKWATEGRTGEQAAVLLAPRHLLLLTNSGELIVARRGTPAFDAERRIRVAESETWATPVLLGKELLVRDAGSLAKLSPGR